MPDFENVHQALEEHEPAFWDIAMKAWSRLNSMPAEYLLDMCPRTRASAMHNYMWAEARKRYPEHRKAPRAPVTWSEDNQLFLLRIGRHIVVRFQKMGDGGVAVTRNVNQRTLDYESQQIMFDDRDVVSLAMGYVLDPYGMEVKAVMVSKPSPDESRVEWTYEVPQPNIGDNVVELRNAEAKKTDAKKSRRVKPKKQEEINKAQEDDQG